jgi:AcrR family transcriptional regulator
MGTSLGRSTQRRGGLKRSLSEGQIVEAALDLTRELGPEKLTMAGLAERLGVGAMTLYSYFRSRDELLDAMACRAAIELYDQHVDLDGASWDLELRTHYHEVRKNLKAHPTLADLLFYRGQVLAGSELDEEIAAHWRRHLDAMIAGGIESTLAVRALYGLSMFCFASALRDEDLRESTEYRQRIEETVTAIGRLPEGTAPDVRFGSDEQFDTMLDLMLRGLKSTFDT